MSLHDPGTGDVADDGGTVRVTVRFTETQLAEVGDLVERGHYISESALIRAAVRHADFSVVRYPRAGTAGRTVTGEPREERTSTRMPAGMVATVEQASGDNGPFDSRCHAIRDALWRLLRGSNGGGAGAE